MQTLSQLHTKSQLQTTLEEPAASQATAEVMTLADQSGFLGARPSGHSKRESHALRPTTQCRREPNAMMYEVAECPE